MKQWESLLNYKVKISGITLLVIGLFLLYKAGYVLGKFAFHILDN